MKHQTIHITFPCQSHRAFSWRYTVGISRRSNTHCDGSWFPCGLHHFHYPLSFFYKLKILSGEGYVKFSLRASPHFPSHRLRSVQVIYIFNFNIKILPEDVTYLRWDVFNILQWFLALVDPLSRAGLFGRMVIMITLGARDFSSEVSGFCQVFLVTRAYGQRCVGLRPTPKIPAVRGKNLWYPG